MTAARTSGRICSLRRAAKRTIPAVGSRAPATPYGRASHKNSYSSRPRSTRWSRPSRPRRQDRNDKPSDEEGTGLAYLRWVDTTRPHPEIIGNNDTLHGETNRILGARWNVAGRSRGVRLAARIGLARRQGSAAETRA